MSNSSHIDKGAVCAFLGLSQLADHAVISYQGRIQTLPYDQCKGILTGAYNTLADLAKTGLHESALVVFTEMQKAVGAMDSSVGNAVSALQRNSLTL